MHVFLVGGTAAIKGLAPRLYDLIIFSIMYLLRRDELRALAPSEFSVNVYVEQNPSFSTWHGASRFVSEVNDISPYRVTLKEYEEYGSNICERKFYH